MTNVEHIDGLKAILRGMSNHKQWGGCHTEEKTALRCLKHVNIPKSLVKKLNIESSVEFVGALDRKEMPWWYQKADVFVLPSLNEGMSNCLLEAMASGLAVVATDTGGTKELVDETNGIIVDQRSHKGIYKALEQIYSNNKILRTMKTASRTKAGLFSRKENCNKYLKLYIQNVRN